MKLLASGFLTLLPTLAFAANQSSSDGLKITEAEALQIEELQVEAAEAAESEDLEHLETLTAQTRNVMKKQMNERFVCR